MNELPHIPALRRGKAYESLDQNQVLDCRDGTPLARLSQVNAGIIRKDLARIGESRAALRHLPVAKLVEICGKAGELFLNGTLPLGSTGATQSPQDYIGTLSATSGLPHVMVRRNMMKIHYALTQMEAILHGLTRRLDWGVLDRGCGEQAGSVMSFYPTAPCLGLVMPSNSPGVNSLWLPAIPLKIPVIIKPGREEPWTPYRLIQSFIAAGCPAEAFGFYPTDHEGAGEILKSCGRALVFGDQTTTAQYAGNAAIQIHGPGYSKILLGEDQADRWPEFVETMVSSVLENGGRSCVNASAIIVPRHGAAIADALARRLGPVAPRALADPDAQLAGFANPKMADFIDAAIDEGLKVPGATEVTALYRKGARKTTLQGGTYLRPTIVHCAAFTHPLANREFLCPYASVVEMAQADMVKQIGPSLVVTAITKDPHFTTQLMEAAHIARLNLGPLSTMKVSWDQPHEGNMFEFLYERRAFERLKQW